DERDVRDERHGPRAREEREEHARRGDPREDRRDAEPTSAPEDEDEEAGRQGREPGDRSRAEVASQDPAESSPPGSDQERVRHEHGAQAPRDRPEGTAPGALET